MAVGPSPLELVAVVLKPAPARAADSPNSKVWIHGVAIGELRLDGLEAAYVNENFALDQEYFVEVSASSEEPTRKT
jgi:hypothetical protein